MTPGTCSAPTTQPTNGMECTQDSECEPSSGNPNNRGQCNGGSTTNTECNTTLTCPPTSPPVTPTLPVRVFALFRALDVKTCDFSSMCLTLSISNEIMIFSQHPHQRQIRLMQQLRHRLQIQQRLLHHNQHLIQLNRHKPTAVVPNALPQSGMLTLVTSTSMDATLAAEELSI